MTRICIFSSHRAERGLLQPLIDKLQAHPGFDLDLFSLAPESDFAANYIGARNRLMTQRPEVVLVPCDRKEALAAALAAFDMDLPIIHFHAGDTGTVSKDEVHRHVISLIASVHLCNGPTARDTVVDMLDAINRTTLHVYDVGSTALDDVEVIESPDGVVPYDLVLYHPPRNEPELINEELDEIESIITTNIVYEDGHAEDVSYRRVYWIHPNGDPGSTIITDRIARVWRSLNGRLYTYSNLPRPTFLGLMKNCSRFIGNSSSMVYEAPAWIREDQIIHIGDRNRNRSFDEIQTGGTDRVMNIMEEINWKTDFKNGAHPR